jgi:hypothetical protein
VMVVSLPQRVRLLSLRLYNAVQLALIHENTAL